MPLNTRLATLDRRAFASHTARALTEAGDHAGAEARHRAAFGSWDPDAFPRVHLLTWTDLGDCLAAQARADESTDGF